MGVNNCGNVYLARGLVSTCGAHGKGAVRRTDPSRCSRRNRAGGMRAFSTCHLGESACGVCTGHRVQFCTYIKFDKYF